MSKNASIKIFFQLIVLLVTSSIHAAVYDEHARIADSNKNPVTDCTALLDSFVNVYKGQIQPHIKQYRAFSKENKIVESDSIKRIVDGMYLDFKEKFSHSCLTTDIRYLENFYYYYAVFTFYFHADERKNQFEELRIMLDRCYQNHQDSSFLFLSNLKSILHLRVNEFTEMKTILEKAIHYGDSRIEKHIDIVFLLRTNYIIYLQMMKLYEEGLEVGLENDRLAQQYGLQSKHRYILNLCFIADGYMALDKTDALKSVLERLKGHCQTEPELKDDENCILEEFYFGLAVKTGNFLQADSILQAGFLKKVSPQSYDIRMNMIKTYMALNRLDEAQELVRQLKETFDTYKVPEIHTYRLSVLKLELDLDILKNKGTLVNTQILKNVENAYLANVYNVFNESPHNQYAIIKPMKNLAWKLLKELYTSEDPEILKSIYTLNTNIRKLTPQFLKKRNHLMEDMSGNDIVNACKEKLENLSKKYAAELKTPGSDIAVKQHLMDSILLTEEAIQSSIVGNLKYMIPNIRIETIKEHLDNHQLYMEFFSHGTNNEKDSALFVAVISDNKFEIKKINYERISTNRDRNFTNDARQNMYGYESIFKPVEGYLKDIKEIIVVSDGIVNTLPIEILSPDGTRKNSLINRIEFRYFNSSKSFVERQNTKDNDMKILALGGINYDCSKNQETGSDLIALRGVTDTLTYLPYTLHEVKNIQSLYTNNVDLLTGCAATKDRFVSMLKNGHYSTIHISTHGIVYGTLDITDPEFLYLKSGNTAFLALANSTEGYLSAYEITNMDLQSVDMIYLSACSSGIGPATLGHGMFSIGEAFYAAGVNKVILSLWDIPDSFASKFSDKFYETLAIGKTVPDAFNQTKKYFSEKYPPVNWAAYRLVE